MFLFGFWSFDFGFWILDSGFWGLDLGVLISFLSTKESRRLDLFVCLGADPI